MPKAAARSMREHAREYARMGLPVIPLHGVLDDGSCTCGVARCPSPGKHPRTRNGLRDATTDPKLIDRWWGDARWPNASIGGVTGTYLCLDIDAKRGGMASLERMIKQNAPLPDTAIAETGEYEGERGLHYWFRVPEGYSPATKTRIREGIDIRCVGGYAVLPPSSHASGVSYTWISRRTIKGAAEAPEWLLGLVEEYIEGDSTWTPDPAFKMSKAVRDFLNGVDGPELGEQREFLTQAARSVLTTGRSVELTASLLWEGSNGEGGINACEWRDGEPWTPEDIYALVADIYRKPPTTPLEKDFSGPEFTLDDAGNAERLLASFKDGHVLFCPELDSWYLWEEDRARFFRDGGRWMSLRWLEITEQLSRQAAAARSEGEQKVLYKHARDSRAKWRVSAAVDMAKLWPVVHEDDLDPDPFAFGVPNGIIDLRSGELREADPSDVITRHGTAEYDPDAQSDLFDQFLARSIPDEELRRYLQLACGYTLTGSTAEHVFFYVYGRPASGKSTFLEAFKAVMGTYALTADSTTFIRESQRGSGPTDDLARLAGARFVVTHEMEKGQHLAVSLINKLTGSDTVAARFLYQTVFEYTPRFKLWIGTNHLPVASGAARSGVWRRVKVIRMDEPLAQADRDPTLFGKLREPEAQRAILAWAVQGSIAWHEQNKAGKALEEPESVTEEVAEYERESNHLLAFIDQALVLTHDDGDRVPVAELFEHYNKWCDLEGRRSRATRTALAEALDDRGLAPARTLRWEGRNARCRDGVQLNGLDDAGINIKGARKRKK